MFLLHVKVICFVNEVFACFLINILWVYFEIKLLILETSNQEREREREREVKVRPLF